MAGPLRLTPRAWPCHCPPQTPQAPTLQKTKGRWQLEKPGHMPSPQSWKGQNGVSLDPTQRLARERLAVQPSLPLRTAGPSTLGGDPRGHLRSYRRQRLHSGPWPGSRLVFPEAPLPLCLVSVLGVLLCAPRAPPTPGMGWSGIPAAPPLFEVGPHQESRPPPSPHPPAWLTATQARGVPQEGGLAEGRRGSGLLVYRLWAHHATRPA